MFGNPAPVVDRKTGTIVLLSTHNAGNVSEMEIRRGGGKSHKNKLGEYSSSTATTQVEHGLNQRRSLKQLKKEIRGGMRQDPDTEFN